MYSRLSRVGSIAYLASNDNYVALPAKTNSMHAVSGTSLQMALVRNISL